MWNQPRNSINRQADDSSRSMTAAWDEAPDARLRTLFLLICLPVMAVGFRLTRIQTTHADQYATAWDRMTVTEEDIPGRDGRILTADGVILAQDTVRFDLAVHYRWIEQPADDRWLTQQALARLTREARRRRDQVDDSRQQVLHDRDNMWKRLAVVSRIPADTLASARAQTQSRVERIANSVADRQEARRTASEVSTPEAALVHGKSGWERLWQTVVSELTTPPHRRQLEPITVREELEYHVLASDVPLEVVAEIASCPSHFHGVRLLQSSDRSYPQGALASHLIGVRTRITSEELQSRRELFAGVDPLDLRTGDRIGRDGVERGFETQIHGHHGRQRMVTNRRGEIISEHVIEPPRHGQDVVLTLDSRLQRKAEQLLDEVLVPSSDPAPSESVSIEPTPVGACLVVLNLWTGDVLAAASAPRHNLQTLIHPNAQEWQALLDDVRRPFFPRVTQMTIPPGSVFKILTAAALLESRGINPDEPYFCQGYLDRPDRDRCYLYRHYGVGHGETTLADALCQSCNVYFYQAARGIGPQPIHEWAQRFGFGMPTGIDIPGERSGHLPDPYSAGLKGEEPWYPGTTLQFAIGQASLTVTPLQIVRMVAAIGNGGYLVTPRAVNAPAEKIDSENYTHGSVIRLAAHDAQLSSESSTERIPGLSIATLQRIQAGMRMVVEHPQGTGRHARIPGLPIAAKTGTAEVGGGKPDHAWFAGYFPADAPQYAFTIVLEHGGSGGRSAAPIAKSMIETMLEAGLVSRTTGEVSASDSPDRANDR